MSTSESLKLVSNEIKCPECDSKDIITDTHRGEMICLNCGCVIEERLVMESPEWRAYNAEDHQKKSRIGSPTSIAIHDKGLATAIGFENHDVYGRKINMHRASTFNRLRRWQSRLRAPRSIDRSLIQAMTELDRLIGQLDLPRNVQETAAVIYREATKKNLIRGRSIESMVAASVYVATRMRRIPRTLEEISSQSRVTRKELGRCFRILIQELHLKVPPSDPVDYVLRYAAELRMNGKTVRAAMNLLHNAKKKGLTGGKDPSGLAAATLYIAGILENDKRAQRQIAKAATVTEVTIRNRYKEIVNKLEMQFSSTEDYEQLDTLI